MSKKQKNIITLDSGEKVEAQSPIIVSASRSTDIPAFYSDWFFARLFKGYSAWINPFNGVKSFISYQDTRLIVFWSKNPKPLFEHLPTLKLKSINTYIQYTLNNYENKKLELGVPKLSERIDTFKKLVDELGQGSVIWRYDPLILSDTLTIDELLERISYIGEQLKGYTEKLVFSFIDINAYKKVKINLSKIEQNYREFTEFEQNYFAENLSSMNKSWGFNLATCGETLDLEKFNINKNKCIDDELIAKLFPSDQILMEHIGRSAPKQIQLTLFDLPTTNTLLVKKAPSKDKGQREACGCIKSKDIGEYNTCPHLCEYCYANASKNRALQNYNIHKQNPFCETITGE